MYDIIGDIHGHADELVQLLNALGYRKGHGSYSHPERQIIFLGDFIDRGPKIREVLEIVRPMVEEGTALAVMGNHELNALAFHTHDANNPATFLRDRSNKNIRQHAKTILQLSDKELNAALDWFSTLPLWLERDGLRAIHACWDEASISQIVRARDGHHRITNGFLQSACRKGEPLYGPVEVILKGKEGKLPNGKSFTDKDGHERTEIRTRWYMPPERQTYGTYALQSDAIDCNLSLDQSVIDAAAPYPITAEPVFFGHYWLSAHRPEILANNVACLDYSVAKHGFLCAYRWNGEPTLSNENFFFVR